MPTAPFLHGKDAATIIPMTPLDSTLAQLERDASLVLPARLKARTEALDWLERMFPEDIPHTRLDARVQALRERLSAADAGLFHSLREAIRQGHGIAAMEPWLDETPAGGDGYDHADALVSGILQLEEPATPAVTLSPDMVFYQPTPARHIFSLLRQLRLAPDDVLVDIGSGLGHVPLLAAILTPARSIGIELEPAYVACARHAADALALRRVRFDAVDARAANYAEGNVFYLYTPFRGSVLRAVLDTLHECSTRRDIRVCTYGPCTATVAGETWLTPLDSRVSSDQVAIFTSRAPDAMA
ncbi:hypothetical protein [Dyella sp. A6]|uniref:hypothetical protein n=1 Tax=Dyella aluminiiresistens TaxID=3069105 RepID=UPI002E768CE1|nr:hypothetical protein [Dyella sp. A6]